jgi:hypothetical protein
MDTIYYAARFIPLRGRNKNLSHKGAFQHIAVSVSYTRSLHTLDISCCNWMARRHSSVTFVFARVVQSVG